MTLILVVHNVRSAHNVGSLFRTADGLGVDKVFLTGYTPYPEHRRDTRLPHEIRKTSSQIHKTALGAEQFIPWEYEQDVFKCLKKLETDGFITVALEQTAKALPLNKFVANNHIVLIVGNEVNGLEDEVLKRVEHHLNIPMKGRKESFNVTIAAAIALYHLKHRL